VPFKSHLKIIFKGNFLASKNGKIIFKGRFWPVGLVKVLKSVVLEKSTDMFFHQELFVSQQKRYNTHTIQREGIDDRHKTNVLLARI
jgi:hypothetical protein